MKKILSISAVLFSGLVAFGQGIPRHPLPPAQPHHQQKPPIFHDQITLPGSPNDKMRRDIYCNQDWQELWNGRHVRIKGGKVRICKRNNDILLKGDEVILLASGNYLVRNSHDWRVYDEDGDRTFIHGKEILAWPGEYYCVRQTDDKWRVYNRHGDRIFNVWGEEIELIRNGLFRCVKNGRVYYFDKDGNERK